MFRSVEPALAGSAEDLLTYSQSIAYVANPGASARYLIAFGERRAYRLPQFVLGARLS